MDAKFSLSYIWNLFQEDALPNNNFCRQMINCMKVWNYLQKTLELPLSIDIIMQMHKIMMDGENMSWWGNMESHLHLQAIILLREWVILKDTWKTQLLGLMRLKSMI